MMTTEHAEKINAQQGLCVADDHFGWYKHESLTWKMIKSCGWSYSKSKFITLISSLLQDQVVKTYSNYLL